MKRVVFIALGFMLLHAPLTVAQTAPRRGFHPSRDFTHRKSPTVARIIGIVPGLGHMYAGEPGHGFIYMGGVAGLSVFALLAATDCVYADTASGDCGAGTTSDVLAVAAVGLWGWSIYDAGRAAERTNARQVRRLTLIVAPGTSTDRGESTGRTLRLGLRVGM